MFLHLKFLIKISFFIIVTFGLMRGLLFFSNFDYFSNLVFSDIISAFIYGIRFDLSIMLALFFIPFSLTFLPGKIFTSSIWVSLISWFCFALLAIALLALAMDVVFFQQLQRHVGVELLQLQGDISYLIPMLTAYWQATLVYFFCVILVAVFWQRTINSRTSILNYPFLHKVFLLPFIFLVMVIIIRGGHIQGKPLGVVNAFNSSSIEQANLTLNGVYTGIRVSQRSSDSRHYNHHHFSDETISKMTGIPRQYPFEKSYAKDARQPNIIVLQIESLAYQFIDQLGHKNYGVTPFLDSIIDQSRVYDQFYAGGQRSIIGLQSTWTGLPGILGFPTIDNGLSSYRISQVAKIATNSGYNTLFAQSSGRKSFRVDALAKSVGFQHYWGKEDITELELNYPEGAPPQFGYDYETLMLLKSKLKQHFKQNINQPVLMGFFSGTMHTPYIKLPKQFEIYPHSDKSINGLLNSIAYTDWSIQQFIEGLRTEPWFNNTVIIITADHSATNYLNKKASYNDLLHIPMIIYSPNPELVTKGRISEVRSQLDIMPTIVDLLGSDQPFSALGNSLFRPNKHIMINNFSYYIGSINESGFVKTNLSKLLETNQTKANADKQYEELLMINQRIAESLQDNKWAH